MKWDNDTKVLAGNGLADPLAHDALLKAPLARKRWHHLLLSATLPSTCTLQVDGRVVASHSNCSLPAVFPYCRPNSNISVVVGSFDGWVQKLGAV